MNVIHYEMQGVKKAHQNSGKIHQGLNCNSVFAGEGEMNENLRERSWHTQRSGITVGTIYTL